MSLLIRGARIVDAHRDLVGDVLVEGDRIAAVGVVVPGRAAGVARVIEGAGRAVIPGFVNTHTHAAMVLFRGYTDDVPLMEWLEQKIWPVERHLGPEHVLAGTKLAALEMLCSGTTAFHDMYFHGPSAAAGAQALGVRAVISQVFFDVFEKRDVAAVMADVEAGLQALSAFANVSASVGPHAPYTTTLPALTAAYALAEKHDTVVHFHIAETEGEMLTFREKHGRGLVAALDAAGFLGPRLVAAHGIFLDADDARVLGQRGVTISHCPSSNMKLSSGYSATGARALPYATLHQAGVRVALGTDGAATNNTLDMFEAMKLAALLQKHTTGRAAALTAHEAFAMATVHGAEALRIDAGLVAPGRRADLLLIDLERPYFCPGHDLIADLVYAGRPDCVDTVVVGGKVVLDGRRHPETRAILAEAKAAADDLFARAKAAASAV